MNHISVIKIYLKYISMYGLGISIIIGYAAEKILKNHTAPNIDKWIDRMVMAAYCLMILTALSYLLYPNYIDHLEPTIAMLGLMFKAGSPLYPSLDTYSFHGLLYGPLLSEIQAVFQFSSNDPILNSKLPGILAFIIFSILAIHSLKDTVAHGYLLLLLPFNLYLFWNRSESFFLILAALSWIACRQTSLKNSIYLGFISGLMFSLKAHGILYAVPFFLISLGRSHVRPTELLKHCGIYLLGMLISIFLCFAPPSVSIPHYTEYIQLASQHGISPALLERNIFFLIFSALPLLTLHWQSSFSQQERWMLTLIAIFEIMAAIAGAKPGAGTHHLMPFIFVNACLLDHLKLKRTGNPNRYKYAFILLATYVIFFDLPACIKNEYKNNIFPQQNEVRYELLRLKDEYPDALMGLGGNETESYARTFYKILLQSPTNQQIDAASFMDLNFSGVDDQPLIEVFKRCQRQTVFLPMQDAPFSIGNFYTGKSLFSDELRNVFQKNYQPVEKETRFFKIYQCHLVK